MIQCFATSIVTCNVNHIVFICTVQYSAQPFARLQSRYNKCITIYKNISL